MLHAVVVIGIDGDETGDGTNITFSIRMVPKRVP